MTENKLTRRESRENAFLAAFSLTFQPEDTADALEAHRESGENELDAYAEQLLKQLQEHLEPIDVMISEHLKGWTLSRLPRVSLTAMRLALTEMLYSEDKKTGVYINEAVELAKKYGSENDYQYVNGVLGAIARALPTDAAAEGSSEPKC